MHWQARKTYRRYSIPLGYKDLLVVQLEAGDFPLAEKRRESILPVFQEGAAVGTRVLEGGPQPP